MQATVFDYNQSVSLITMVIVGGVASRWGAFAGALVAQYLAVYPQEIAQYRFLLYGGLIAVLMIALPRRDRELRGPLVRGPADGAAERR